MQVLDDLATRLPLSSRTSQSTSPSVRPRLTTRASARKFPVQTGFRKLIFNSTVVKVSPPASPLAHANPIAASAISHNTHRASSRADSHAEVLLAIPPWPVLVQSQSIGSPPGLRSEPASALPALPSASAPASSRLQSSCSSATSPEPTPRRSRPHNTSASSLPARMTAPPDAWSHGNAWWHVYSSTNRNTPHARTPGTIVDEPRCLPSLDTLYIPSRSV